MEEPERKPAIMFVKLVLLLILIVLAMGAAMTAMIGMGYLLAMVFPLTLFQATAIGLGTTFLIAFIIFGVALNMHIGGITRLIKESFEEYDEDEEYDEYDEELERLRRRFGKRIQVVNPAKTGRNAPCPCGSGKKYKMCCGKN